VLQEAVKETSSKALADRDERPAMQPSVSLPEDQAEIERVLAGEADLAYSMTFEVLPKFELTDFKGLKLERLTADVAPEAIDKAIGDLAGRATTWAPDAERLAASGDRVTVDFVGTIGGEAFEGGSTEDAQIVLGQGGFIPGFEEGLGGAKAGEERTIAATFPADYPVEALAGKEASFAVKIKEVAAPVPPAIDDEFAKNFGAESLEKLKELVAAQIAREYETASRLKLKRELLDQLEKVHSFELPPSLVESEFEAIWRQFNENLQQSSRTLQDALQDEGKTEDEARAEYRRIAERRVRLGLVVGEIGERNAIKITQDELRRALIEQARRFPGHEKSVYEYYEKTPGALADLRAPIFEDKVVDFVLEKVQPPEKKVAREELFQMVEAATGA
jgi:trigger factor